MRSAAGKKMAALEPDACSFVYIRALSQWASVWHTPRPKQTSASACRQGFSLRPRDLEQPLGIFFSGACLAARRRTKLPL